MPCIAGRSLPARTGYTIRAAIYMNVFYSPQRANIIRVTLPRRYSAQDLRRRNLVTMSRVRDGTSPTVRDAAKYPHVCT